MNIEIRQLMQFIFYLMIGISLVIISFGLASKVSIKSNYNIRKLRKPLERRERKKLYELGKSEAYRIFLKTNRKVLKIHSSSLRRAAIEEQGILHSILLFSRWYLPLCTVALGFIVSPVLFIISIWIKIGSEIFIYIRIQKRKETFKKEAYRIYEFWNNQLSSGVNQWDAIENMYLATTDRTLRDQLKHMGTYFLSTNDINGALNYIKENYQSNEATIFCSLIKQIVLTGNNSEAIENEEEVLLEEFVNSIKANSLWYELRIVVIAILLGIGFLAFAFVPEVLNALKLSKDLM